jgi:hypothetical protein
MTDLEMQYCTEFLVVEFNMAQAYLRVTWLKQPTSQVFREQISKITSLALRKQLFRVLFDVRKRNFIDLSDQNWLLREIIPRFKGKQVRFAYVETVKGLEMMDTFRIQHAVKHTPLLEGKFDMELFINPDEACHWLLEIGENHYL